MANEMRACKLKDDLESQHTLLQKYMLLKRPLVSWKDNLPNATLCSWHMFETKMNPDQNSEQFYFVFFVPEMTRQSNIVFICAFNSIIPHVSSAADMNHCVILRTVVFFMGQGQEACQHSLVQHFLHFLKCNSLF